MPELITSPLSARASQATADIDVLSKAALSLVVFEPLTTDPQLFDWYNAGNKTCKLAGSLSTYVAGGYQGVVGLGGSWSNFIHSLAITAAKLQIPSVGIIRGLHHQHSPNAMLADAASLGMDLHFLSSEDYRQRHNPEWSITLAERFPGHLILPEGASNIASARACQEMLSVQVPATAPPTHWACAVGTGATMAGIAAAMQPGQKLLACQVVNDPTVEKQARHWVDALDKENGHCGRSVNRVLWRQCYAPRYGKLDQSLCLLINSVFEQSGVLLDPLYTAKALRAALQELQSYEHNGANDLPHMALVHTGGLQGWRGLHDKNRRWLSDSVNAALADMNQYYRNLSHNKQPQH